jgi:hypothetical protein
MVIFGPPPPARGITPVTPVGLQTAVQPEFLVAPLRRAASHTLHITVHGIHLGSTHSDRPSAPSEHIPSALRLTQR